MQLVHKADFTASHQPEGWNVGDRGDRVNGDNVVLEDGATSFWTRPNTSGDGGDLWQGGNIVYETALTYCRIVVDVRVDPGRFTKALLLLWPEGDDDPITRDWPPEIDFLEQGGTDNWTRQWITTTAHFGEQVDGKHPMVHRILDTPSTDWGKASCYWDEEIIRYGWRRGTIKKFVTISNPGIHEPMKPHITYWPHHNDADDPYPIAESRMQVKQVQIFQ